MVGRELLILSFPKALDTVSKTIAQNQLLKAQKLTKSMPSIATVEPRLTDTPQQQTPTILILSFPKVSDTVSKTIAQNQLLKAQKLTKSMPSIATVEPRFIITLCATRHFSVLEYTFQSTMVLRLMYTVINLRSTKSSNLDKYFITNTIYDRDVACTLNGHHVWKF